MPYANADRLPSRSEYRAAFPLTLQEENSQHGWKRADQEYDQISEARSAICLYERFIRDGVYKGEQAARAQTQIVAWCEWLDKFLASYEAKVQDVEGVASRLVPSVQFPQAAE